MVIACARGPLICRCCLSDGQYFYVCVMSAVLYLVSLLYMILIVHVHMLFLGRVGTHHSSTHMILIDA